MASSAGDAPKPALKRSLFNKPAWSRPAATVSGADFFHRSTQTYLDIAAEEELKKKRRAARKAQERVRHGSGSEGEGKRRRISNENESEDERVTSEEGTSGEEEELQETTPTKANTKSPESLLSPAKPPQSHVSLARRYESTVAAAETPKKPPLPSDIIDLDVADAAIQSTPPKVSIPETNPTAKPPPPEYDEFMASDEEFPELARKAREKARSKRLQTESFSTAMPDPASQPSQDRSPADIEKSVQHVPPPPPLPEEPVVSILLTSRISNTNPLIVNRRLGQRLKDVRMAWCQRQSFTPDFTKTVILTWRGKRLFDVSTCKSLGIGVDADGNIVMKGEKDVLGEENRQIHMEAMTEEMFQEQRLERERAAAKEAESVDAEEEPVVEQPKAEQQIRIILRSKGHEDFKLIVKPTTLISRIVNAFKQAKGIPPHQGASLQFDGEFLEPSSQIGDTELTDMDFVDVYIK